MYQLTFNDSVIRVFDGSAIPADPENMDYQAYLAWVADGNEPEPYAPIIQPITVFSSLDYLQKFTDSEYQAARTGTMRAQRALDMLIAAQYVDIENDPRVPAALNIMIEDCGMTPERKAELLTPQAA